MQQDFFVLNKKTFRCISPANIASGIDTNALGLFHRPYFPVDKIPINRQFEPDVGHEFMYWGKDILVKDCEIDGRGCAEGLKISFGYNVRIEGCIIHGGQEDCVDIVRGANISFKNCKFISYNTKQHFTIKGGCKNITIEDCEFVNDFSNWYDGAILDIGNWGDYDQYPRPRVRHVTIKDCRLTNIKFKLLSRVLYGNIPNVQNTEGYIFKVPNFITKMFFYLRNTGRLGKVRDVTMDDRLVYDIELI
jgi:hypothetical protein